MVKKSDPKEIDASTEERIKQAARTVFLKKGFAATRTRDIAEEAGLNLALLNYYFRSKAKLYEIIMIETFSDFIKEIFVVLNDEKTSIEAKVEGVVSRYIDRIIKEPEIPTFIITEIRSNPTELLKMLPIERVVNSSVFFKQHEMAVKEGKITEPNPLHFLLNLVSLIIFPFLAKPIIMESRNLKLSEFNNLMVERKKLIPIWIKAFMTAE